MSWHQISGELRNMAGGFYDKASGLTIGENNGNWK